jgi:hypothetical protein
MLYEPLYSLDNEKAVVASVEFEAARQSAARFVESLDKGARAFPNYEDGRVVMPVENVMSKDRMHAIFDAVSMETWKASATIKDDTFRIEMSVRDFMLGFTPAAFRNFKI